MNRLQVPAPRPSPVHEGQPNTVSRLSSGVGRRLSVVIPTRNRREALLATLRGLSRQSASPESYEVIVVADGCTDGTASAVHALSNGPHWQGRGTRLVCVEQEWSGASAARNRGLKEAQGEIALLLDDDMQADPRLIEAHRDCHAEGESCPRVVLGHVIPERAKGALHRQLSRSLRNRYRRLLTSEPFFTDLYTGNASFPRSSAFDIGGLDERIHYGEDVELGYRLGRAGLRFVFAPAARSLHRDVKPPDGLLRDLQRSGQGCVQIWRKWPQAGAALPFRTYREMAPHTLVAKALLAASNRPEVARFLNSTFKRWAASDVAGRLSTFIFRVARSYYFWRGVKAEVRDDNEWRELTSGQWEDDRRPTMDGGRSMTYEG